MTDIREPLHGAEADAVREQLREPSNLTISVNVARLLLAKHEQVDHRDLYAVNRAHGALAEALRLVLRAVDTEPQAADFPRSGEVSPRCPAAQADDPSPCDGPRIVTVYAPLGEGIDGCGHHAAQLLAATNNTHPVALPDAPNGSASEVFRAAASLRYFAAHQGGGR